MRVPRPVTFVLTAALVGSISAVAVPVGAARTVALLLLGGCVLDYSQAGRQDGEVPPLGDTSAETAPSQDTGTPPNDSGLPVEECDGVDNDGDGEVDEGFGDVDADGVADCLDDACELRLDSAETPDEESACSGSVTPSVGPWDVEVAWRHWNAGGCDELAVADLDGDGTAEVACSDDNGEGLEVVSGSDGTVLWTSAELAEGTGLAIADLDGDGALELLGIGSDGRVKALSASGIVTWSSRQAIGPVHAGAAGMYAFDLQVADLDGDGVPEIVGHHGVVDGTTGHLVTWLDTTDDRGWWYERELAVADLDDDGAAEIVDRLAVYAHDGRTLSTIAYSDPAATITPMIVQGPLGPDPTLVRMLADRLWIGDADGTAWTERALGNTIVAYPCAGDVDGDGDVELIYAGSDTLVVLSPEGAIELEIPIVDATDGYMGCTTFDFDLDGAKEIVFGDGEDFYILGGDGQVLFRDPDWGSVTVGEFPRVVDLDGDGSVEIVVNETKGDGYGHPAITVYRNVHRDWPPGTQLWPTSNWSGTSLNLDGTVPRTADKPWETTLVWRGQPEYAIPGGDLFPKVVDACAATCEDGATVRVSLRLGNLGPEEARDASVAVYAEASDGTRSLLTVAAVGWIDEDTLSATVEVDVPLEAARQGLVFVAGDDGTGTLPTDCDEGNNALSWRFEDCDAR